MNRVVFIPIVALLAIVINMPSSVSFGKFNLYRPSFDFTVLGRRFQRDLDIKLGLDLQGGTHLVYQADTANLSAADKLKAINSVQANIEKRINLLGVAESIVQISKSGDQYRLIVELPGVKDVNQAISIIGQTAKLEFREAKSATPASQMDFTSTDLSGADLKSAQVQFGGGKNQASGQLAVSLEFTPSGGKKFADITARNVGKPLAIFLDERIITAPTVQSTINDGRAVISGSFSLDEAKAMVIQLNAGSLPVPIKIVEQRNIGATLGQDAISKSLLAATVAIVTVWIFMLVNYGWRGLLADFALVIYILVSLALVRLIPITLTLAGIAGMILSIGMAVDANILIFERIKEELRWGRPLTVAVELGFHRAWNSIRDSNTSSLITAGILFWFGTGSVRGFALTLFVGIVVSLFSSITVTKALLKLWRS